MDRVVLINNNYLRGIRGSRQGFTLLEMLIALTILSVSILALTMVTLTSIEANRGNELRDAAVRLTSQKASELQALPIVSVVSGTETRSVDMRGRPYNFTVSWTVNGLTNDLREVTIVVSYVIKGKTYTNSAVIYRHRAV